MESFNRRVALILVCLLLAGCGGGHSTSNGGGSVQADQRAASLKAVGDYWRSLPRLDRAANAQAMRTFLSSRPEFTRVGISSDLCIYAFFQNGQPLLILNSQPYDQTLSTRSRRAESRVINAEPTEIPGASARLYFMHGAFEGALLDPRKDGAGGKGLRDILNTVGGYTVTLEADGLISGVKLTQMRIPRDPKGEAVLFTGCHGGLMPLTPGAAESLVLSTDQTPIPLADLLDSDLQADLKAVDDAGKPIMPRVVTVIVDEAEAVGLDGKIINASVTKYAITPAFVKEYMKFAPNSFWFNNACDGANQEMADAAFSKGLTCYMGWDISVYRPESNQVVRHLFDRIAGTNLTGKWPENPPQRPFTWNEIFIDMDARGLNRINGQNRSGKPATAKLIPFVNRAYTYVFGLLAPTISAGYLDGSTLRIFGTFGQPGAPFKVFVGSRDMTARTTWNNADEMVVQPLPELGAGSSGDVVVQVNGHKSNAIRITEWRGEFTTVYDGPGTLKSTITYDIHFRALLRANRQVPHTPPGLDAQVSTISVLSDSTCRFDVDTTGRYETEEFILTQERVGPAEVPFIISDTAPRSARFFINLSGNAFPLDVQFGAFCIIQDGGIRFNTYDKKTQKTSSSVNPLNSLGVVGRTTMDEHFRIIGGQTPNGTNAYSKYNYMDAIHPPDLSGTRSVSPGRRPARLR